MSRKFFVITACFLAVMVIISASAFAQKKEIKLSHSHQADFASEIHTAAWIFQKWVHDNSDTLEVKIYAANALGEGIYYVKGLSVFVI